MQHATSSAPPSTPLARFSAAASEWTQRYWRLVVVAMLALLHVAVVRGVADPWARALLLAHLGLLLLWQPFVRAHQRISPAQTIVLAVGAAAVMLWLGWWLLAFWVMVLAGLVGGKVYQHAARWQRRCYLVVFLYLVALLAVIILPEVAPRREIAPEIRRAAEYGLPLLFVLIALFPAERELPEAAQVIDFFYSLFLMLVLVVVVLGSFTIMSIGRTGYIQALANTVLLVGGAVLLIALAWNPRTGFAGLNVFFSRYLFSIGLPLEKWLHFLTELSQLERRPERFLGEAAAALARLPWVAGATWRAGGAAGMEGEATPHQVDFESATVSLRLFSRYRMSPALHWHLRLLALLLGEFYVAKLRDEELRRASYLQAVHETGARMTHDIKNLLQSLNVITAAATREENDTPEVRALLRRQLPAIAKRLSETLDKLQRPLAADEDSVPAQAWWEALERQYRGEGVEFDAAPLPEDARLPRSLFDSVADNLIRNALAKRAVEEQIRVQVALRIGSATMLRVRDTGRAVPESVVPTLLKAPVTSPGGLGIGLFQAARLAESRGFRLDLESNRDGDVSFVLAGPPA
ncbi:MAG TPA: ATP-binding protein [Burkholderiales bacterium]|nr:ATP-binding protein [Burkholderiales bacterium]